MFAARSCWQIFLTVLVASAVPHYYLFLIMLTTGHVIHLAVFVIALVLIARAMIR